MCYFASGFFVADVGGTTDFLMTDDATFGFTADPVAVDVAGFFAGVLGTPVGDVTPPSSFLSPDGAGADEATFFCTEPNSVARTRDANWSEQ